MLPAVPLQVGGASLAVVDKAQTGPQFGADGLKVPLQVGATEGNSAVDVRSRLLDIPAVSGGVRGGMRRICLYRYVSCRKKGQMVVLIHYSQGSDGKERTAQSRLGSYYARRPDGSRSLFAADEDWKAATLTELKVLVADGDPEQWELDGILWKTS